MIGEPTGGFKVLHAEDVGTRITHMMELQNTWSTCLGILTCPGYHSPLEEIRAKELETALDLLQHHLEAEYNMVKYAEVINALPQPTKGDPPDAASWRDTV
jgi:hypothetical protein